MDATIAEVRTIAASERSERATRTERGGEALLWARHFTQYRSLHSDPRFAAILSEMASPEENEEGRS